MSYARFGRQSDVYVFLSVSGCFECCSCCLEGGGRSRVFETTDELVAHLFEHELHGGLVPPDTFTRLFVDKRVNDAWIAGDIADEDELLDDDGD